MDSLAQQLPSIIEQAARSPLGLLALMVIALAILGLVFFRGASERTRVGIFVLLFMGVAAFGVAAVRSTASLAPGPSSSTPSADFDGRWRARVEYSWGVSRTEDFVLEVEDGEVRGTASFLGVDRAIQEGGVEGDRIRFATRTLEVLGAGDAPREVTRRYEGRVADGVIQLVLRSEGGYSEHPPVEFVARRVE